MVRCILGYDPIRRVEAAPRLTQAAQILDATSILCCPDKPEDE